MTRLIDGKKISASEVEQLAVDTRQFIAESSVTPGLAVVLVGDDPASQVYVRNKVKQATAAGFNSTEHRLPEDTGQAQLNALVEQLNNDPSVHGILVQLPLPAQLSEPEIIRLIAP